VSAGTGWRESSDHCDIAFDGEGYTMQTLSRWVGRHRLAVFFVLAFAISWSSLVPVALGLMPHMEFLPCGPLVAAVIVIGLAEGAAGYRSWGRRLIRWRVGIQWWIVAVTLPVGVHLAAAGLNSGLGGPAVELAALSWSSVLGAFALRLVMPLDGPFGEEPGWRGFAVPEMQRRWSPLGTAALLGVLVASWHLPLVFDGNLDGAVELATTFVVTFVYVWLFNRTGGSTLLVIVFHSAEGLVQENAFGATGADLARSVWLTLGVWTAVALAVVVFDRAAWRRPGVQAERPVPSVRESAVAAAATP
jgi:membrane protease YdiL (CAAX protease family)